MTHTPAISIIMPVYKVEAYLETCLRSILSQTLTNFELIAIDDGSPDSCPQILDAYASQDSRIRVIHQENHGYGQAANRGIDEAQGSYICFIDSDDYISHNMLASLYQLVTTHRVPIAKASYADVRGNQEIEAGKFNHIKEGIYRPADIKEYFFGHPCIWSAIYERDFLNQHRIRFNETPKAAFQDIGFSLRSWLAAPAIYITQQSFYKYRNDNPSSSINAGPASAWYAIKELELLQSEILALPRSSSRLRSLILQRFYDDMLITYKRLVCNIEEGQELLANYSRILNRCLHLKHLDRTHFSKSTWHDIELLYMRPAHFRKHAHLLTKWRHRILSLRRLTGRRVLHLFGARYDLWAVKS